MSITNKKENARDLALDLLDSHHIQSHFDDQYKFEVFWVWYMNGRPSGQVLQGMIDPNPEGVIPSPITLGDWMRSYKYLADEMDTKIKTTLEEKAITAKVEMLQRHAKIGQDMQVIAVDFIEAHSDQLTANAAVRLLVEAVKMERESRGLPTLITQTINSTDEELMKQIEDLMSVVEDNVILNDKGLPDL